MSLETRIVALAQAIGTDIKGLRTIIGNLANLNSTGTNLVAVLNEVISNVQNNSTAIGTIGDLSVYGATDIVQALNALNTIAENHSTALGNTGNLGVYGASDVAGAINILNSNIGTLSTSIGNLLDLTTTNRNSLVDAVNELVSGLGGVDLTAIIDDLALVGTLDKTYSVSKITSLLNALKGEILDSAPEALNTLNELAAALSNNPNLAADLATALGLRVRVDAAQAFDAAQQTQGRANIGAAAATVLQTVSDDLDALVAVIGNTNADFLAEYNAAKA